MDSEHRAGISIDAIELVTAVRLRDQLHGNYIRETLRASTDSPVAEAYRACIFYLHNEFPVVMGEVPRSICM